MVCPCHYRTLEEEHTTKCGIVFVFLKNSSLENLLGRLLTPMLVEMIERGPESTGFALYGPEPPRNRIKVTLSAAGPVNWPGVAEDFEHALEAGVDYFVGASHAAFILPAAEDSIRGAIAARVCLNEMIGGHANGKSHTRNLEAEDLVALTIEAAAMAGVPLAGTDWIPRK